MRFILLLLAGPLAVQHANAAVFADLTGEWSLRTGRGIVSQVNLPHGRTLPTAIPGYWLERSIVLPPEPPDGEIALGVGTIPGSYRVSVNGVDIGGQEVSAYTYGSTPAAYAVPPAVLRSQPNLAISIRVEHRQNLGNTFYIDRDKGPWVLAPAGVAHEMVSRSVFQRSVERTPLLLLAVPQALLAILLFLAFRTSPESPALLWMALLSVSGALMNGLNYAGVSSPTFNIPIQAELALTLLGIRPGWWRVPIWALFAPRLIQYAGLMAEPGLQGLSDVGVLLLCIVQIVRSPRHRLIGAALVALTIVSLNASPYVRIFSLETIAGTWRWPNTRAAQAVLAAGMAAYVIRELLANQGERRRLAAEIEMGRVIQQLLVPSQVENQGGYRIETVYLPAAEVGGDFCQVLPNTDGSVLMVLGDVSGKGLKAAMLATLMTGVVRARAALTPAALLEEMNRVVGERSGGFVTCLAVRCEAGGKVTMANAGHLAPYIGGAEAIVESGLPLGITLDAEYRETELRLDEGVLAAVTDGIVEAANAKGELFGFDRTREISTRPAREIAEAAKAWGQNDDITVVTVRRSAS